MMRIIKHGTCTITRIFIGNGRYKSSEYMEFRASFIFPYLRAKKAELRYLEDQFSLSIMDTFKHQDNENIKSSCLQNSCELVIRLQNLTNKFQPLDIIINQKAQKFVSN